MRDVRCEIKGVGSGGINNSNFTYACTVSSYGLVVPFASPIDIAIMGF